MIVSNLLNLGIKGMSHKVHIAVVNVASHPREEAYVGAASCVVKKPQNVLIAKHEEIRLKDLQ